MAFQVPNEYRIREGALATTADYGNNGAFVIRSIHGVLFRAIASDRFGWEHVSVSLQHRCPTWDEMCFIKSMFWGPEDTVVQYHPAESEYVNCHPYCLHLWRPVGISVPTPPSIMVGPR